MALLPQRQDRGFGLHGQAGGAAMRAGGTIDQPGLALLPVPRQPLVDRGSRHPELLSNPRRRPPRLITLHHQLPGIHRRTCVSVTHRGPPGLVVDASQHPLRPEALPTINPTRRPQPHESRHQDGTQLRQRGRPAAADARHPNCPHPRPRRAPDRAAPLGTQFGWRRSEEHTSELQSRENLVCRLLLENKNKTRSIRTTSVVRWHPPPPPPAPARPRAPRPPPFRTISPLHHPATTDVYTLPLHDALPISSSGNAGAQPRPTLATRTARTPDPAVPPTARHPWARSSGG